MGDGGIASWLSHTCDLGIGCGYPARCRVGDAEIASWLSHTCDFGIGCGYPARCRVGNVGIASWVSHNCDLGIGSEVATLPCAWHYRFSTRTGVSVQRLDKIAA